MDGIKAKLRSVGFKSVLQGGSAWILERCNMYGKGKSSEDNTVKVRALKTR